MNFIKFSLFKIIIYYFKIFKCKSMMQFPRHSFGLSIASGPRRRHRVLTVNIYIYIQVKPTRGPVMFFFSAPFAPPVFFLFYFSCSAKERTSEKARETLRRARLWR